MDTPDTLRRATSPKRRQQHADDSCPSRTQAACTPWKQKMAAVRSWPAKLKARAPALALCLAAAVGVVSVVVNEMRGSISYGRGSLTVAALITLNAVVLSVIYVNLQRSILLSGRNRAGDQMLGQVVAMMVLTLCGTTLGVGYLLLPACEWALGAAVGFLLVSPWLIPFAAFQELIARFSKPDPGRSYADTEAVGEVDSGL